MARARERHDLLVVDGYNVLLATPRYEGLIDEDAGPARLGHDPFVRAREALVSDVATYAQGRYDAVIVYDGANNHSDVRPNLSAAGVRQVFSREGESADEVIERLVTDARESGRGVALVTSDNTVRATVGTVVTRISSTTLVHEMEADDASVEQARLERASTHMTLEDRLPPEQRAKLWALLRS